MPRSSGAGRRKQSLVNSYAVDGARRGRPGVAPAAVAVLVGAVGAAVLGAGTAAAEPGPEPDPVSSTSYRQLGSSSDAAAQILSGNPDTDLSFDVLPSSDAADTADDRPVSVSRERLASETDPVGRDGGAAEAAGDPGRRTLAELEAGARSAQAARAGADQVQAGEIGTDGDPTQQRPSPTPDLPGEGGGADLPEPGRYPTGNAPDRPPAPIDGGDPTGSRPASGSEPEPGPEPLSPPAEAVSEPDPDDRTGGTSAGTGEPRRRTLTELLAGAQEAQARRRAGSDEDTGVPATSPPADGGYPVEDRPPAASSGDGTSSGPTGPTPTGQPTPPVDPGGGTALTGGGRTGEDTGSGPDSSTTQQPPAPGSGAAANPQWEVPSGSVLRTPPPQPALGTGSPSTSFGERSPAPPVEGGSSGISEPAGSDSGVESGSGPPVRSGSGPEQVPDTASGPPDDEAPTQADPGQEGNPIRDFFRLHPDFDLWSREAWTPTPENLTYTVFGVGGSSGVNASQLRAANPGLTLGRSFLQQTPGQPLNVARDLALLGVNNQQIMEDPVADVVVKGSIVSAIATGSQEFARRVLNPIGDRFLANRGTPRTAKTLFEAPLTNPTIVGISFAVPALNLAVDTALRAQGLEEDYSANLIGNATALCLGVAVPISIAARKPSWPACYWPAGQSAAAQLATEPPEHDAVFGVGDTADGNAANTVRTLGNATATVAGPVLDVLGGGSAPNPIESVRETYDYVMTGEPPPDRPIVSERASTAAEAARVRTQSAWAAAREGEARNRWDDLNKLGANGVALLGRGATGLAHTVVAPVADPLQSAQSRFVEEPTQAQRGREGFSDAGQAWQEAGEAVDGLLGRSPTQPAGSRYPTCGGDVTDECIEPRSLRDDDGDGRADNAGVLRDGTVGAPSPGSTAYQECYDRGECGDQSVPGSAGYGEGEAGEGFVGPRFPTDATVEQLQEVYSSPAFAQHAERSFAAQPQAAPPQLVDPVQATVDRGVQAATDGARWVGDRADDLADAAERNRFVGGAVRLLRKIPGLGGDGDPDR